MGELIHVGSASDSRFAIPMAAMILSAVTNVSPDASIAFQIIDGGLSELERKRIAEMIARVGKRHSIYWYRSDSSRIAKLPQTTRFPKQVFLRLLAPELLPPEITRLIWLDSDTLVEEDLAELWKVPLKATKMGAVLEYGVDRVGNLYPSETCKSALLMDPDMPYFNSGVLLIDLLAWRQQDFANRLIRFIECSKDTIQFPDQDALNSCSSGNWTCLDRRWNVQMAAMYYYATLPLERRPLWYREQSANLIKNPGIIHYTTAKPWNSAMFSAARRDYFKYVRRSQMLSRRGYALYRLASIINTITPALKRLIRVRP